MPRLQVRQIQLASSPSDVIWSRGDWLDVRSAVWLTGFVIPHELIAYEFRNVEEDASEFLPVGHPSNPVAVRIPDGYEQIAIRTGDLYPQFKPKAETA